MTLCSRTLDSASRPPLKCKEGDLVKPFQKSKTGTPLVDQWLRLGAPTTGSTGLIPGRGSKMPTSLMARDKNKKKSKITPPQRATERQGLGMGKREEENKTTYFSTAIAASSNSSSWQYILRARSNS